MLIPYPWASLDAVMETNDAVGTWSDAHTDSNQLLLGGQAVLALLSAP